MTTQLSFGHTSRTERERGTNSWRVTRKGKEGFSPLCQKWPIYPSKLPPRLYRLTNMLDICNPPLPLLLAASRSVKYVLSLRPQSRPVVFEGGSVRGLQCNDVLNGRKERWWNAAEVRGWMCITPALQYSTFSVLTNCSLTIIMAARFWSYMTTYCTPRASFIKL